jgi:hypothetical protein
MRNARAGFAAPKLIVEGRSYLLLRKNAKWGDLNLIGGHEKERDRGSLLRTAQRELWEEVPSVREVRKFHLEPLTPELLYGPVHSRSAGRDTEYQLQFFAVHFDESPMRLLAGLGARSRNVLVPEEWLLTQTVVRVSGLITLLHRQLPGGMAAIPHSWLYNLELPPWWRGSDLDQLELSLL